MKLVSLKCPACGANIDIDKGLFTFYCKYCGTKIYLDENNPTMIRAQLREKEMEHEEKMYQMKLETKKSLFGPDNRSQAEIKEEHEYEIKLLEKCIKLFIVCAVIIIFILIFANH